MPSDPVPSVLTFLFTDLENSTRLWELYPDAMRPVLSKHDAPFQIIVEENNGRRVRPTGYGLHDVFGHPADAVAAALAAQRDRWMVAGARLSQDEAVALAL